MIKLFSGKCALFGAGILVFCLVARTEAACIGGADEMKSLHKKLLSDYKPAVQPSRNYSTPIEVSIQLHVSFVLGLDTKRQLIYLRAFVRLNWIDEYLQWEPKDHGCIKRIVVPQNSIWKPDIILNNAANEHDNIGSERVFISVNSNGLAKWEPPFYLEGTCKLDLTKYPFDVSLCPIVIASWMTNNQSMILWMPDDPIDLKSMIINGEYEVSPGDATKAVFTYEDEFFEVVTFNIRLARRPMYIAVSLLVPVNLLAILGILSFIMPPEEPEKVSISITILLSFTVFLAFIDNNIPATSDNISLLVIYISALLVLSFLSVVGNVVIVTIKTQDQNDAENLHASKIENILKQHPTADILYKNKQQENIKSSESLLETVNYDLFSSDPSLMQIFVSAERKAKHKNFNTRASRMNRIFLIVCFAIFGFISCLMLALILF